MRIDIPRPYDDRRNVRRLGPSEQDMLALAERYQKIISEKLSLAESFARSAKFASDRLDAIDESDRSAHEAQVEELSAIEMRMIEESEALLRSIKRDQERVRSLRRHAPNLRPVGALRISVPPLRCNRARSSRRARVVARVAAKTTSTGDPDPEPDSDRPRITRSSKGGAA